MTSKKILVATPHHQQALPITIPHTYATLYTQPICTQIVPSIRKHPEIACILFDLELSDSFTRLVQDLKTHYLSHHLPIILLTHQTPDITALIQTGVDDCIHISDRPEQIHQRLELNIARAQRTQHANPLTHLPGNNLICQAINKNLSHMFAILYIDLDNFKTYNDTYGFSSGDHLLTHTSTILKQAVQQYGNWQDFIGHIGGDDFIIISSPDKAEFLARAICAHFDHDIARFYKQDDAHLQKLTLSIVILNNHTSTYGTVPHISQRAALLKKYVKSRPTGKRVSNYIKEQANSLSQIFTPMLE